MSGEIRIEGLAAVNDALLTALQKDAIKEAVKVHGASLTQKAQEKAPVGTPESTHKPGYVGGTLKASIRMELTDGGMSAEVEPHTEYAAYVEYGTRYMNAKPYMRPAFEEVSAEFIKDIKDIMGD